MLWLFLIISTLAWGIAEIFYKKGSFAKEKYSHLKTTVFVGFAMGIYATGVLIYLFAKYGAHAFNPINILLYLPVSLCYIVSMTCSYFGVRFIEESISDPIENTSGAIVPILCAIFLHETVGWKAVIAIVVIVLGILCIGFFDKKGDGDRKKAYGKKLAIFAFAMPFCYAMLDAVGTFLDIWYTEEAADSLLRGVTDATLEHVANCCYEFTFFAISIGILIFLKVKGEKLFTLGNAEEEASSEIEAPKKHWYTGVIKQKDKIFAAIFETIGQATYLFALSEGKGIAAVILGAGTVITSLILSRIVLKEKLSIKQYIFIFIILLGIIALALFE